MSEVNIGHGITLNFTRKEGEASPSDVWIHLSGGDGKSATISTAAMAERMGGVIGAGLRSWASDRINDHMATGPENPAGLSRESRRLLNE